MHKSTVTVRDLNQRTSEVVSAVLSGEVVEVTRGKAKKERLYMIPARQGQTREELETLINTILGEPISIRELMQPIDSERTDALEQLIAMREEAPW